MLLTNQDSEKTQNGEWWFVFTMEKAAWSLNLVILATEKQWFQWLLKLQSSSFFTMFL